MKLLVIGLDGGDRDIINSMDMPCLQKLLQERVSVPIKEDLWSRGWSEIATGLHGRETGAFYEKPKLDGTTDFAQSYKIDDYYKVPHCVPLWDKLSDLGKTVGFLNLPTTLPAPKVSGFFISGAGSGYSPASRVPEVACYPKEIYDLLLEENFIWEQRFRVSGIQNLDYFIDRCTQAVIKRTNVFLRLSKEKSIDFGFLMQKEAVTINNLFMLEIQSILDNNGKLKNSIQRRIAEFYRVLDDLVYVVINQLQPEHIMIVSDHCARPYHHSLNLNAFLKNNDFLKTSSSESKKSTSIRGKLSNLKKVVKSKLASSNNISNENPFTESWPSIGKINYKQSVAFSNRYVPGIYLNDHRFLSVVEEADKKNLINRIIDLFNASAEAKKFNMSAIPYRESYQDSLAESYLPDIWINLPDTVFPEGKGNFLQQNPYWKHFNSLEFVEKDIMTGMKGRNALCSVEGAFVNKDTLQQENDLTIAYHLICNHFQK